MTLQKCLLVADDPDDHQAFTNAVMEISDSAVVVVILDSSKALSLLLERSFKPNCIFIDLSMAGIRINTFVKTLRNQHDLKEIPVILYGDNNTFIDTGEYGTLHYFRKDYEYSELREMLKGVITHL